MHPQLIFVLWSEQKPCYKKEKKTPANQAQ